MPVRTGWWGLGDGVADDVVAEAVGKDVDVGSGAEFEGDEDESGRSNQPPASSNATRTAPPLIRFHDMHPR